MADVEELRGRALYDALIALKPVELAETDWAVQAGVNRGFFTNIKSAPISPRSDTLRKLLRQIGRTEAELYDAAAGRLPARRSALVKGVEPDQGPTRSVDGGETAPVMRMNLSYAMGPGTNLDEDYIEGEPVQLDIGFLRRLTPSAPGMLRIVNGIGDSMQPTIHDSEELILDLGQRTLNLQDRIWAMSLYGVGAVKRLKAIGRERVLVISDNPDVPDQEVEIEDIILVGRIVGSIRRH